MCGIIGYKGLREASGIILEGLRNLEYRGYDSVGIATLESNELHIRKDMGKVDEVNKKLNFLEMPGNMGIGHTRWATHGGVTKANAHPHISDDKRIAVVHNGIIENYQKLKEFLTDKGIRFHTETDTEVIPQLIQYRMQEGHDFKSAVINSLKQLEGSFAIVAMNKDMDYMIAARRNSPLVLGIGKNEVFAASDVPAFLEHTKEVLYLEDDEYVILDDSLKIFSLTNDREIKRGPVTISWSLEQARKGDYPHFMMKEIVEQKQSIKRAVEQDQKLISQLTKMLQSAFGIFFIGCGTSYHACVSASYQFADVAKKHVNVTLSSEFKNYEAFLTDKTVVVALSQSGETADTIDAIKAAKRHGAKVIAVVNVMGSTITRLADISIMMNAGPEICVLSTKSYTSQVSILLLLAYSVAGRLEEGKRLIANASTEVPELINANLERLKHLAKELKNKQHIFLIGRDLAYPSSLEGALKIKEVSYIHAEGFAGGELKHGTIALIDKDTPAIILSTEHTRKEILSNAMEIKSRGGYIIGIDAVPNEIYDYHIPCPEFGMANPILMIIPLQILSYYLAIERGCDPDKPRNLAKSVTVK